METLPGSEPCTEKRSKAQDRLFPSVSKLRARLNALSVDGVEGGSVGSVDGRNADSGGLTAGRLDELKALLKSAETLDDPKFTLEVRIRLAEEELINEFYKGAAILNKKAARRLPTICELIHYRKHRNEELQVIFDRAATADSLAGKEAAFLSQQLAADTRLIRRAEDPHFSETGNSDKEATLRKGERVRKLINRAVDRVLGIKGPEALAILAAYQGSSPWAPPDR